MILTASIVDNACTQFGSSKGEGFLGKQSNLSSKFLSFCSGKSTKTLSMYLSVCSSVCLSVHLSVCLPCPASVFLSFCLCVSTFLMHNLLNAEFTFKDGM